MIPRPSNWAATWYLVRVLSIVKQRPPVGGSDFDAVIIIREGLISLSNVLSSGRWDNIWRVGEAVNTYAFHAYIHGFKSHTRHQLVPWCSGYHACLSRRRSRVQVP